MTIAKEWFRLDLSTAIRSIQIIKNGEKFFKSFSKIFREEIIPRPEQEIAIVKTFAYFQHEKEFLSNAKLSLAKLFVRFKTL